jgi:NAD(P)-dependent dehydrogenase (short-subunit alcohol dehydrogenase family)
MKIAMVTGATSGIGEACARKFAHEGYSVIITGRREERLDSLKTELEKDGVSVLPLYFDVCDRAQAKKILDSLPDEWQNIDVLINNAGLARGLEPEYEGDFTDWDEMIDTNIKGLLNITRYIVPKMVKGNHARLKSLNLKLGRHLLKKTFNAHEHGMVVAQMLRNFLSMLYIELSYKAFVYKVNATAHLTFLENHVALRKLHRHKDAFQNIKFIMRHCTVTP